MNQLHCWMSSLWLLLCLTVCTCRATVIYGIEGQAVILPCKYDSRYHGVCDVCWMKGNIPTNGCGAQILYANQKRVLQRSDVRYQLLGALQKGDASLTIFNVRKSDAGKYGCRVQVPGWFNDKKFSINLVIREAPRRTTTTPGYVTTTTQIPTKAPVSTTQHETTSVTEDVTTKHPETEQTYTTPGYVTTTTQIPSKAPVSTTQHETTSVTEDVTTKHPETEQTYTTPGYVTTTTQIPSKAPVSTTQHETTSVTEDVTMKHPETEQTYTTPGYVTTTTQIPSKAPVSTTQDETTSVTDDVTTKHPETEQTYTTLGYVTTTTLIPTQGPILTTHIETTAIPEYVTTERKETQESLSTLGYVSTTAHSVTHGPVVTTHDETTRTPQHVITQDTVTTAMISENDPEMKPVSDDADILAAISVSVILIVLILGISAVCVMSKQRRWRKTLELAKNASISVSYSNLESSVALPMTESSKNEYEK
ncbi:T-cell immunoglobulin and mucin domain-containing protein 4-like isoform X10 [Neoarius graeffei]|uniref:T-cell immunoglobulin and mucin domain-containing protein 4-like isoform X10 n=1 Tax=Neoarius graeffei TaxID=443677 RepID=UPI00298CF5AE|nr:T-cell immunoglobulin and mucin domain-containing protein 4-like isoform X10 [Neoarius graeffei]